MGEEMREMTPAEATRFERQQEAFWGAFNAAQKAGRDEEGCWQAAEDAAAKIH
jgi:hypothetical protein